MLIHEDDTDDWGNLSWITCMDWIDFGDGNLVGYFDEEVKL